MSQSRDVICLDWRSVLHTLDITMFRCVVCPVLLSIILQYCVKVYEMVNILYVLG
jgi:hypothetical protein